MRKRNIGMMFLTYGANLWYLVGIRRKPPALTDENAYGDYVCGAYIGAEGGITLIAPRMGSSFFKLEAQNKPWIDHVRIIDETEKPSDVVQEVMKHFDLCGKDISVDDRSWALSTLELQKLLPARRCCLASEIIAPMRMIKDREEIAVMRKAGEITDRVYAEVLKFLREGLTERDVVSEIDRLLAKNRVEQPSFTTGVTFTRPGEGSSVGARRAGDMPLRKGHSICFDFGVCYEGYCSDFGRTAFVGDPPGEVRKIHDLIMQAQSSAIQAMVSGTITASQLDEVARNIIKAKGYGEYFTHRLGHGIGVTVHEPPFLYPPDETRLVSGMTFTVEPSILIPDSYGCRVEDVVLVSEAGGLPLTNFNKELTVIE